MLLRVHHETRYEYSPGVETAQHQLHLRPRDDGRGGSQQLLGHRLRIGPEPEQVSSEADVYGNTRTFFALTSAHDTLQVVADSLVSTSPAPTLALLGADPAWETVRDRYRYRGRIASDEAAEFIFPSPYIPRLDALLTYARRSFAPGLGLLAGVSDLMSRIHADFVYESQSTDVNTPIAEAFAQRKGVCQDFAHIMIAGLRGMGLPARYASGYLLTAPPPGKPRLIGSDASHAWLQVYLPAAEARNIGTDTGTDGLPGRWVDFDPTNNQRAGEDYILLAVGRDFSDVSPMRGVLHGGASHQLQVRVTVAPPDDPSWLALADPTPPALLEQS